MNTKLKCLLLDDELPGLAYLKMLCEQLPELEVIKAFNSPEKLLEQIPNLDFDLCITDIEMPGMDGLTLASLLNHKLVIFTTAYKNYASEAFDIDAIDYITKPVTLERLQKAVGKAIAHYRKPSPSRKFVQLNTDKGKALLYFDQIVYIKSAKQDSRDKEVFLMDGGVLVLKNINFETLIMQLPQDGFCRISKKEIIAIDQVQFFNHNEITLHKKSNEGRFIALTLSETYRQDFLMRVKI